MFASSRLEYEPKSFAIRGNYFFPRPLDFKKQWTIFTISNRKNRPFNLLCLLCYSTTIILMDSISTRRFFAIPSGVSFDATGRLKPYPTEFILPDSMPCETK